MQISNYNRNKYCYACIVPHGSALAPAVVVPPALASVLAPAVPTAVPTAPSGQSTSFISSSSVLIHIIIIFFMLKCIFIYHWP